MDIPYWLLIIIFATPPLLAIARNHRRRNREKKGQCIKCGYQLDAGMTTCPECGAQRITITTRDDSSGNSMLIR